MGAPQNAQCHLVVLIPSGKGKIVDLACQALIISVWTVLTQRFTTPAELTHDGSPIGYTKKHRHFLTTPIGGE